MPLSLTLSDATTGAFLVDLAPYTMKCVAETGENGFASLSADVRMPLRRALQIVDQGTPYLIQLASGSTIVWEGRLEQSGVTSDRDGSSLTINAKGYASALMDVPYTALWSTTRVNDFRVIKSTEYTNAREGKYNFDTNNRLYIALQKNTLYTNNADIGAMLFQHPHSSTRNVIKVSFDYTVALTAGFVAQCNAINGDFTSEAGVWSLTASGATQTGSVAVSFTGKNTLVFRIYNASGANITYGGENGDAFLRVTNLRIASDLSVPLDAAVIVKDLISTTIAVNPTQLSPSTAWIQSTGVDLQNEIYEDTYPADILDHLAAIGDTAARAYEWGVWEGRQLHFRKRGSAGNQWHVDVTSLEFERSLREVYNSAYAVYSDANNATVRGATSSNVASVGRLGITRRKAVSAKTTSATQANTIRDTVLSDSADPMPRASIRFNQIFTASGAVVPSWRVRAGDTITIRNLPPTLAAITDRMRTFRISRTKYDAIAGVLTIEPESPLPRIETYLARQAEGI